MILSRRWMLVPVVVSSAVLLAGCGPTAPTTDSGSGNSGGDSGGGSSLDCSSVTGDSYELFVDPRLTVEPSSDVYPLEAGDSIGFTNTDPDALANYTTYGFDSYYIDGGNAFRNDGAIFVGAEDSGKFSLDGPQAPSGIDGGPYPGFVEITATTTAGTEILARLCVVFATSE